MMNMADLLVLRETASADGLRKKELGEKSCFLVILVNDSISAGFTTVAAACEVSLRLNGSLASEQRMDDDNTDGNDNEKEFDVTH